MEKGPDQKEGNLSNPNKYPIDKFLLWTTLIQWFSWNWIIWFWSIWVIVFIVHVLHVQPRNAIWMLATITELGLWVLCTLTISRNEFCAQTIQVLCFSRKAPTQNPSKLLSTYARLGSRIKNGFWKKKNLYFWKVCFHLSLQAKASLHCFPSTLFLP